LRMGFMTTSNEPMAKPTLRALLESIDHWKQMKAQPELDVPSTSQCNLCRLFFPDREMPEADACNGCPVYVSTGQKFCNGSPYRNAYRAWRKLTLCFADEIEQAKIEWTVAAQAEIDFLESLLPKEPTQ
jgi:Pyruvate/2-oxoacid:ferredoxin oxidoreductase delta subunit